jgi:biotin carboxyl carrier protein
VAHHDAEMTERTPEERRADHAAIDRLADELLPALVAKLGASGLGELDVREGAWRIRLRMPADGRASRRTGGSSRGGHQSPSPHAAPAHAAPPTRSSSQPASPESDPGPPTRAVATSPAVGFYRPRPDRPAGARVRVGDPLGAIDVLGVPQELTSPADGIVGASLVQPGDPVEYGQDVVEIELLGAPAAPPPGATLATATRPEAG